MTHIGIRGKILKQTKVRHLYKTTTHHKDGPSAERRRLNPYHTKVQKTNMDVPLCDTGWLQTPLNNHLVVVYHSGLGKSMEGAAIMKKIMSVGELKRYYENRRPKQILFCTANQAWHKVDDPVKIALSFTSMVMACNPNVICLKSGENMIWFERVKNITVDSDRTPLGTVLDIVCGDSVGRGNDIHYTVITS